MMTNYVLHFPVQGLFTYPQNSFSITFIYIYMYIYLYQVGLENWNRNEHYGTSILLIFLW